MSNRDDFSKSTKDTLAKRVCFHCSNPSCNRATIGPHSEISKSTLVGVAAHITAAAPGGPRYDITLSDEERRSFINGIWLCVNCSTIIDKDPNSYPQALLIQWKEQTERNALENLTGEIYKINNTTPRPIVELNLVYSQSGRTPKGISEKNFKDGNRTLYAGQDYIQFWILDWKYKIELINNSSLPAFNILIKQIEGINKPKIDSISKINNIPPYEKIETRLEMNCFYEGYHKDADKLICMDVPPILHDIKFEISYSDEARKIFKTTVTFVNGEIEQNI